MVDATSNDGDRPAEPDASHDKMLVPNREMLEALAEFCAGAGHEINNPLATIIGRAELIHRRLAAAASTGEVVETQRDLRIIAGQAQRIRDMIGDLMLFARPPKPKLESVDLCAVCLDAARPFVEEANRLNVTLHLPAGDEPIHVRADRVQLAVVVSELIRNALEAVAERGQVAVRIEARDSKGVFASLLVEDDGRGLTSLDQQHLFHPFYSGRNAGRGLGFGLCKCWRILEQHGGRISIQPRVPGGTLAIVEWPLSTESLPADRSILSLRAD
jgi:signal transduction histidine kinase